MYSTFMGLETAYRALITSQAAIDTTGQNISNASTTGYSRQIANTQATIPLTINANSRDLSIGTGSFLTDITRVRDAYLDQQYRRETSQYEYWSGKEATLSLTEQFFNETSDYSLSSDMSEFWSAWSDLANSPEESASRIVVREKAVSLTETFHNIDQQITALQKDLDNSVDATITKINTISDQIRLLNNQIRNAEIRGDNPNDLKDQRDQIVDELSGLVPVTVIESLDSNFTDRSVGNYTVIIGNSTDSNNVLVSNGNAYHLQEDPVPTDAATGFSEVWWEASADGTKTAAEVDLGSGMGSLQADIEMRDTYLSEFRDNLNTLVTVIADSVNALHQSGQGLTIDTGLDFFTSTDLTSSITAANIIVNQDIQDDVNLIASGIADATGVSSGDSSIALAISSLASGWDSLTTYASVPASVTALGASSVSDYYEGLTAELGSDVEQSTRMAEGQNVLATQLGNSREALSGVSLDEEMIDMIKFQKGYSSAARIVTVLDTMLESLLGMGVTK